MTEEADEQARSRACQHSDHEESNGKSAVRLPDVSNTTNAGSVMRSVEKPRTLERRVSEGSYPRCRRDWSQATARAGKYGPRNADPRRAGAASS